jgi:putative YphP/YqiW family bacilliredoxin
MREDLTRLGFEELLTAEQVDQVFQNEPGTVLVVVNSICGCAAGKARPGVALALRHQAVPDRLVTVFAGMEIEATERARSYLEGYPPSSPSIALLKGGQLLFMLERKDIEGRGPEDIAADLIRAFDRYCTAS